MAAKDMKELENMLLKEMRKAMKSASKEILTDMKEETKGFYTQGNPKMYERTGALGETPETSDLVSVGNTVSFKAYLNTASQYTTGDNPNMQQVLQLANYGNPWVTSSGRLARDTLGKKGFWERAESKMQSDLDKAMSKHFHR